MQPTIKIYILIDGESVEVHKSIDGSFFWVYKYFSIMKDNKDIRLIYNNLIMDITKTPRDYLIPNQAKIEVKTVEELF